MYKHGEIKRTIYDNNKYEFNDDEVKIYMYDKEGNEIGFTLIDLEAFDKVKDYKIDIETRKTARI